MAPCACSGRLCSLGTSLATGRSTPPQLPCPGLWHSRPCMRSWTATSIGVMALDPHDPHSNEWYALLVAGTATVAAAIWKVVFAVRRDIRDDRSGEARHSVVAELQAEVRRLAAMVTELVKSWTTRRASGGCGERKPRFAAADHRARKSTRRGAGMTLRDHPIIWISSLIAVCVVGALGGLVWAEDRYQSKADAADKIAQIKAQNAAEISVLRGDVRAVKEHVEYAADRNSKGYIEDQLFRLEQIKPEKLTDSDRAQIGKTA